jgi:hypothetical protein
VPSALPPGVKDGSTTSTIGTMRSFDFGQLTTNPGQAFEVDLNTVNFGDVRLNTIVENLRDTQSGIEYSEFAFTDDKNGMHV